MQAVKAKEKEMKDEKEAERQVGALRNSIVEMTYQHSPNNSDKNTSDKGKARCQSRKGAI
jgi:hypothetical protein